MTTGFIRGGDYLPHELLNALTTQIHPNKASIDAAIAEMDDRNQRLEGVAYADKDGRALYLDLGEGELLTVIAPINSPADIAAPRQLGVGGLNAAAGNHAHDISVVENDVDLGIFVSRGYPTSCYNL